MKKSNIFILLLILVNICFPVKSMEFDPKFYEDWSDETESRNPTLPREIVLEILSNLALDKTYEESTSKELGIFYRTIAALKMTNNKEFANIASDLLQKLTSTIDYGELLSNESWSEILSNLTPSQISTNVEENSELFTFLKTIAQLQRTSRRLKTLANDVLHRWERTLSKEDASNLYQVAEKLGNYRLKLMVNSIIGRLEKQNRGYCIICNKKFTEPTLAEHKQKVHDIYPAGSGPAPLSSVEVPKPYRGSIESSWRE